MNTPPPPPPYSSAPPPPPPPPPPAKKGSNTLVVVLCVLAGVFVLIGGCVATCTYIAAKKVKTYAEESQKNPAYAALSMAASLNPDVQVISKDPASGKITVKNKKTGQIETIDTTQYSADNIASSLEKFAQSAQAAANQASAAAAAASSSSAPMMEKEEASAPPSSAPKVSSAQAAALKGSLKKFPSDFPMYDSGGVTNLEATHNSLGQGAIYQHSFTTSDSPEDVVTYYQKKLLAAGYTQLANENGTNENGATAMTAFQKAEGGATLSVKVEMQNGKSKVDVQSIMVKAP